MSENRKAGVRTPAFFVAVHHDKVIEPNKKTRLPLRSRVFLTRSRVGQHLERLTDALPDSKSAIGCPRLRLPVVFNHIGISINRSSRLKLSRRFGGDSQPDGMSFKLTFQTDVRSQLIVFRHRLGLPVKTLYGIKRRHHFLQIKHVTRDRSLPIVGPTKEFRVGHKQSHFPLRTTQLFVMTMEVAANRSQYIIRMKCFSHQTSQPLDPSRRNWFRRTIPIEAITEFVGQHGTLRSVE